MLCWQLFKEKACNHSLQTFQHNGLQQMSEMLLYTYKTSEQPVYLTIAHVMTLLRSDNTHLLRPVGCMCLVKSLHALPIFPNFQLWKVPVAAWRHQAGWAAAPGFVPFLSTWTAVMSHTAWIWLFDAFCRQAVSQLWDMGRALSHQSTSSAEQGLCSCVLPEKQSGGRPEENYGSLKLICVSSWGDNMLFCPSLSAA